MSVSKEIEIRECQVEDVDNAIRELWLGLAREMYEIEHVILPSKDNCVKWINYSARAHNTEWSRQLIQKNNLEGFFDASLESGNPIKTYFSIVLNC
jgi:hypothetical protein